MAMLASAGTGSFSVLQKFDSYPNFFLDGISQLISSSISAGWISGGSVETDLFRNFSKYSTHLSIWSLKLVRTFPFLLIHEVT